MTLRPADSTIDEIADEIAARAARGIASPKRPSARRRHLPQIAGWVRHHGRQRPSTGCPIWLAYMRLEDPHGLSPITTDEVWASR